MVQLANPKTKPFNCSTCAEGPTGLLKILSTQPVDIGRGILFLWDKRQDESGVCSQHPYTGLGIIRRRPLRPPRLVTAHTHFHWSAQNKTKTTGTTATTPRTHSQHVSTTLQNTLHIAHCTLHIAHCTLHIAHCTMRIAHCTSRVTLRCLFDL